MGRFQPQPLVEVTHGATSAVAMSNFSRGLWPICSGQLWLRMGDFGRVQWQSHPRVIFIEAISQIDHAASSIVTSNQVFFGQLLSIF